MKSYDYAEKNTRRRTCRNKSKHLYSQGRYNRRAFAVNGAFGNEPAAIYNLCALGTTAAEKRVGKSKETYDDRADYDS